MTSDLAKWLDREGITQSDFARDLGVHKSLVRMWIAGKRRPHLILAARIQLETNGCVPVETWGHPPLRTLSNGAIAILGHAIRASLGMTSMARVFGLSPLTVRSLLNGHMPPKPETLRRLNMRLPEPVTRGDFLKEEHHA